MHHAIRVAGAHGSNEDILTAKDPERCRKCGRILGAGKLGPGTDFTIKCPHCKAYNCIQVKPAEAESGRIASERRME